MIIPKCTRISCRPKQSERNYRACDRYSIWCATSGCYHNVVASTLEEATTEWTKLIQGRSDDVEPSS